MTTLYQTAKPDLDLPHFPFAPPQGAGGEVGQGEGYMIRVVVLVNYIKSRCSRFWGLGSSGTQNMVKRSVLSNVGPVPSEATAKVLLHKPIAIQRAIAIRFCNANSLDR